MMVAPPLEPAIGASPHASAARAWRKHAASGSTVALLVSLLAHAAGIALIPAWQSAPHVAEMAAPATLRWRIVSSPPKPVETSQVTREARANPARVAPASSPQAPPAVVNAHTHSHSDSRALSQRPQLQVHRESEQARPAQMEGPSPQVAERDMRGPAIGDQPAAPPNAAAKSAPAARDTLAYAAPRADVSRHTDVSYLYNPKPAYPRMARKLGLEGTVMLRILVNQAGEPGEARVVGSSGTEVLDVAALEAIRQWRFVPARNGELAITHWVDVPITFKLAAQ